MLICLFVGREIIAALEIDWVDILEPQGPVRDWFSESSRFCQFALISIK
jgi:hypothetical protein